MKNVVIVIPTYDEKENIGNLLDTILTQTKKNQDLSISILVADDNSPDGTADVVRQYSKRFPNIFLLKGERRGLGSAYIRAFNHVIKKMNMDIIVQMDADFSHNPQDIFRLTDKILENYDYVIGSRYIEGGSIPANWPKLRVLNSKVGNFFARYIAGLRQIKDCTSGFKAINTDLLKRINLKKIGAHGFAFQMNLLNEAIRLKARIIEIPIHFNDRTNGNSKMRMSDVREFIMNSLKIRIARSKKFASFFFGVATFSSVIAFAQNYTIFPSNSWNLFILGFFFLLCVSMTIQSILTSYGMVYVWEQPERIKKSNSPKFYSEAKYSFTAMIPALHEAAVIGSTIEAASNINYPENKKEVLVICRSDDKDTIAAVKESIRRIGKNNIHLIIPDFTPRNKPDKLNFALGHATKDVVAIFDAEDSPHGDIYNIINTLMLKENVDVVQAGVQLINYRSKWFSTLNVLEYFFWFKSVLHLFTKMGFVLLGGNTVFFKREWLLKVGGWDANCLTEDADIGIRLSTAGAKIKVIYDEVHATKEETPPDIFSFIKQRTRWNQGFIQIFRQMKWSKLPTFSQKFWAGYILIWPEIQAMLFGYIIFSFIMIFSVKLPILLALLSNIPLYVLVIQVIILNIGLYEFTKKYNLHYPIWISIKIILTFIPFQLVLGISAARAVFRELTNKKGWEKTEHINAHRGMEFEKRYSHV